MPAIGVLVYVLWLLAPNGGELSAPLNQAASGALEPLATLAAPLADTWMIYHGQDAWGLAFFVPPETPPLGLPFPAPERTLSALRIPRLFLYDPAFRANGALVSLGAMPVDVSEYLFTGLIEGFLSRELGRSTNFAQWFDGLAARTLAEVPEDQRRSAYALAAAGFGAHMLSIANEIYRAADRARRAGRDPCKLTQSPLAGLWERSFATGRYAGGYMHRPAASEEATSGAATESSRPRGRWLETRGALSLEDKQAWVERVFGGAWTGRAVEDFADLCGPNP